MGILSEVKIEVPDKENHPCLVKCCVNGEEIRQVRSVDFHVSAREIPTFKFETVGMPEIDMMGAVQYSFTPGSVREAILIVRNELLQREKLYNGYLASIKSALDECSEDKGNDFKAKAILRRIIWEE